MKLYESDAANVATIDKYNEPDQYLEGFDYIAETDKTASNIFAPEQVTKEELLWVLRGVIHACEHMDRYKKLLFRGRTREELRLGPIRESEQWNPTPEVEDLVHGIVGIITETAETAQILKTYLETGRIDNANVMEEAGDLLWYLSRIMKYLRTSFLVCMKRNIAKLRQRHGPDGFNKERDINRDLAAEHKIISDR